MKKVASVSARRSFDSSKQECIIETKVGNAGCL